MNEIKTEPFSDYLANPAISSGKIRDMLKSAATYQHNIKFPRKQTEAMKLGSLVHTCVLEPHLFDSKYALLITPEFKTKKGDVAKNPWATTEGKKYYEEFLEHHKGKEIAEESEMVVVEGIKKSLDANPLVCDLLKNGMAEKSFYFTDPETGLQCKARPDFISDATANRKRIAVDLKTTRDAAFEPFRRSVEKFGYHIQAAFYLHAINQFFPGEVDDYVWLAAETVPPNHSVLYRANSMCLDAGIWYFKKGLDMIKKCQEMDFYPGYGWDWIANEYRVEEMDLPKEQVFLSAD